MSDENGDEYGPAEDTTPPELRWLDYRDPRVTADPDNYTTMNERSGHTLVAPRCTGRTAAGPRCKGPATMFGEGGKIVCSAHSPLKKEKAKPRRGGSLKDRLRSRADEDYDALEEELLTLAQSATASKVFTCSGCKKRNTVEIADAAVRLRAIEAIFDRTGAAKATAANKGDDDLLTVAANADWAAIQRMPTEDLIRLRDFALARDADVLEAAMQRQRDHDALRSEYGGKRVVEMALRSSQDEQALKRIRDELNTMFPPETTATAAA